MLHSFLRGLFAVSITLLLSACGGGGGGGDSSAGSSGGGEASSSSGGGSSSSSGGETPVSYNAYLPADDDLQFYYNWDSAPTHFEDVIIGSEHARALVFPSGAKYYFLSNETGIYYLGFYAPDLYIDGVGTYTVDLRLNKKVLLWKDGLADGDEANVSDSGTADISPKYGKQDFTYTADRVYAGKLDVATPYGNFNAQTVGLDVEANAQIDGTTVILRISHLFAFAEGLGIARLRDSDYDLQLTDYVGPFTGGNGSSSSSSSSSGGSSSSSGSSSSGGSSSSSSGGGGTPVDSDGDGVADSNDAFPNDPDESVDTDNDGVGNNADTDDDNDGITDSNDAFPTDPNEVADFDGDGIGDNADTDDDNDGYADTEDNYPYDPDKWAKLALVNASHNFVYVRGSSDNSFTYTVNVSAENLDWQLQDVTAPGITTDVTSGHGDGAIVFTVDMTQVPVDTLSQSFSVIDTDAGDTETITVTFDIQLPQLTVAESSQELDASFGWDITELVNQVSLNTGSNSYPTDISVDFPLSGSWNAPAQIDVDGTSQNLKLELIPTYFTEGEHTGTVTLTTNVDGEEIQGSFDFTIRASKHLLIAYDNGIGLSSFPDRQVLSQSVKIGDSYQLSGESWSAVSSANWLSVTASGVTGNSLTVTADPTGLDADTLHTAVVSVSSSNSATENTESIYVSLWVGSTAPQQKISIDADYAVLVADPVKPYVYVASGNSVDTYNIYTGQMEDNFTLPVATIDTLAISGDGQKLFASDSAQSMLASYDLNLGQATSNTYAKAPVYVRFGRINGQPLLFSYYKEDQYSTFGRLQVVDANDLSLITDATEHNSAYGMDLDVSQNGTVYCSTSSSSGCFDLGYSSLTRELSLARRSDISAKNKVAVSFDGTAVYTVSRATYSFDKVDTSDGTLLQNFPGVAYPCCVETGPNDEILTGAADYYNSGTADIWLYNQAGDSLYSGHISEYNESINSENLTLSADGRIAIALTSKPRIVFDLIH